MTLEGYREIVGDATFFAALRKYVDENRLKLAKPRALVDAFEEDTLETLATKVHAAEHALLPAVIARLSEAGR